MKEPDLLGKPNYTVHSNKKYKEEKTKFTTVKNVIAVVLSLVALIMVTNIDPNWNTDEPTKIVIYNMAWIIICAITPFGVCKGVSNFINYVGERRKLRYTEKTIPVELRLYDDCAVKYISEDGHEVYIQMPYDNIRQCCFFSILNTVSFRGRFTKVSFLETDQYHLNPKYETVTTVTVPGTYNILSEITNHSPIQIYKDKTEDSNNENT